MSRIDELLRELAPSGVPFVPMWKLTAWDKKFNAVDRTKQHATRRYTYVLASELKEMAVPDGGTVKLLGTGSDDFGWTTPEIAGDRVATAEIVAIPSGGNPSVQYYNGPFVTSDNRIAVVLDRAALETRFLYYVLLSRLDEIRSFYRGAGIQHPSMSNILDMMIPVPPVEVQREIVRVLDLFKELEADSSASLEAELEARRRQYHHYRAEVVRESQKNDRYTLGTLESSGVIELGRGKIISKIDLAKTPGNYPVYSSSGAGIGEFGQYGHYMFEDERITWSVDGGGKFFYRHPHRFSVTNVSGWMTVDASILRVKYLYYVLSVQWEKEYFDYTRKAHPSVVRDIYEVSIPPLEEQRRIVEVLDKFDALVNDLSIGLPAELAARRKQYEYYRDKLLTFSEIGNYDGRRN